MSQDRQPHPERLPGEPGAERGVRAWRATPAAQRRGYVAHCFVQNLAIGDCAAPCRRFGGLIEKSKHGRPLPQRTVPVPQAPAPVLGALDSRLSRPAGHGPCCGGAQLRTQHTNWPRRNRQNRVRAPSRQPRPARCAIGCTHDLGKHAHTAAHGDDVADDAPGCA